MSKGWKGGSTYAWRQVRAARLRMDGGLCQLKEPGQWRTRTGVAQCQVRADCVHHLHGRGKCSGCKVDAIDHLVSACTPCNLRIGEPGSRPNIEDPPVKSVSAW